MVAIAFFLLIIFMRKLVKLKISFFSLLTLLLFACVLRAETRQEIRNAENRADHNFSKGGQEKSSQYEKEFAENFANTSKIGFTEIVREQDRVDIALNTIVSALTNKMKNIDSLLVIRISCGEDSSFLSVAYRYRIVEWEVEGEKNYSGKSLTDSNGLLKLAIQSKGSLRGRIVIIKIGSVVKRMTLGVGPYEFFFPQSVCN